MRVFPQVKKKKSVCIYFSACSTQGVAYVRPNLPPRKPSKSRIKSRGEEKSLNLVIRNWPRRAGRGGRRDLQTAPGAAHLTASTPSRDPLLRGLVVSRPLCRRRPCGRRRGQPLAASCPGGQALGPAAVGNRVLPAPTACGPGEGGPRLVQPWEDMLALADPPMAASRESWKQRARPSRVHTPPLGPVRW